MAIGTKVSSTSRAISARGDGFNDPAFFAGHRASALACVLWDDSVDGHLPIQVSNGGMGMGVYIPANCFISHVMAKILVVPVGPTNMGASLQDDFDLIASAGISGAPWSTDNAMVHGVVVRSDTADVAFTTKVITSAIREIQMVATVAVSSAGRVALYLDVHPSQSETQGAFV